MSFIYRNRSLRKVLKIAAADVYWELSDMAWRTRSDNENIRAGRSNNRATKQWSDKSDVTKRVRAALMVIIHLML